MAEVYLGLGSNKGDTIENLRRGIAMLAPQIEVKKISSVYLSAPMYEEHQDHFHNIAVQGTTTLTPFDLLKHAKEIERQLGRQEGNRNGPRELDIDILFFDDLILNTPELSIPHPRMHERPFVLVPMEEIARRKMHPVLEKEVIELWAEVGGPSGVVWQTDLELWSR